MSAYRATVSTSGMQSTSRNTRCSAPRQDRRLGPDIPGCCQWRVPLDNTHHRGDGLRMRLGDDVRDARVSHGDRHVEIRWPALAGQPHPDRAGARDVPAQWSRPPSVDGSRGAPAACWSARPGGRRLSGRRDQWTTVTTGRHREPPRAQALPATPAGPASEHIPPRSPSARARGRSHPVRRRDGPAPRSPRVDERPRFRPLRSDRRD